MRLEQMLLGMFLFLQVFLQQTPRDSSQAWRDVMCLTIHSINITSECADTFGIDIGFEYHFQTRSGDMGLSESRVPPTKIQLYIDIANHIQ